MLFLIVLLLATAGAAALRRADGARTWARLGFGAAMAVAGVAHLVRPEPFVQHIPPEVPGAMALVVASGLVEIALGAALCSSRWARPAGLATAAYLLAVWPANIYVAVAGIDVEGQPGGAYPWLRVPVQLLLIAWVLWAVGGRRPQAGTSTSIVTEKGSRPSPPDASYSSSRTS